MNARKKLEEIRQYLEMTRQVGHTTGMLEGANYTNNALILTHNMKMGEEIKKKLGSPSSVTVQSIHSDAMLRGYRKPLFIDNAALWLLLLEAEAEFETLERENRDLKTLLAAQDRVISEQDEKIGFCPP
jgi:hypothetical protein